MAQSTMGQHRRLDPVLIVHDVKLEKVICKTDIMFKELDTGTSAHRTCTGLEACTSSECKAVRGPRGSPVREAIRSRQACRCGSDKKCRWHASSVVKYSAQAVHPKPAGVMFRSFGEGPGSACESTCSEGILVSRKYHKSEAVSWHFRTKHCQEVPWQ